MNATTTITATLAVFFGVLFTGILMLGGAPVVDTAIVGGSVGALVFLTLSLVFAGGGTGHV